MPLSYREIMETDLGALKDAAGAWRAMGKKFETLQTRYDDNARQVVGINRWTGVGAMASVTNSAFTAHEFEAAGIQAAAVAQHLDTGYTELHRLKEELKDLVQEARDKHYVVDAKTGKVTYDTDQLTAKERDDATTMNKVHERETEWNEAIHRLVKRIDNEDGNVKRRLLTETKDRDGKGDPNGFNGAADGSASRVDARRTADLTEKFNDGGLNASQTAEWKRLLSANEDDPVYSRTLLNTVGADGLITATNGLNDKAYQDDTGGKKQYLGVEKGLANVLDTATRPPNRKNYGSDAAYQKARGRWKDFYGDWRKEMREAGTREYDSSVIGDKVNAVQKEHGQQVKGYQSLVTLMKHGDGYSTTMLHDLTDDIMTVDNKDKDAWDLKGDFDSKSDDWFAIDPLDDVLGIMSENPGASTEYFDPKTQPLDGVPSLKDSDQNNRLNYLMHERGDGWKVVDTTRWSGNIPMDGPDQELGDNRSGFGDALQAAMTGHDPSDKPPSEGSEHTAAERRVLQDVVQQYADTTATDQGAMPENIRRNMGDALAYYPEDVHDILGKGGRYDALVEREELTQFIRAASEDGGAFRVIHDSQTAYTGAQISDLTHDDFTSGPDGKDPDTAKGVVQEGGKVLGALDRTRADVFADHGDSEVAKNNWDAKYAYHGVGGPLTLIPVAGDGVQRLVDIGTAQYAENMNAEVGGKTQEQIQEVYADKGNKGLEGMIRKQAGDVHVPEEVMKETGGRGQDIYGWAEGAYNDGLRNTERATGD